MAPLKFLWFPSVPLLLLSSPTASNGDSGVTLSLGTAGSCFTEINDARQSAGLAAFTQGGGQLPTEYQESNVWSPICHFILGGRKAPALNQTDRSVGTYALHRVNDPARLDCNATVKHWKDAANNFVGLPPSRTDGVLLYENPDNVSFIAVFNPQRGASADCRLATCTGGPTQDPGSTVEQALDDMDPPSRPLKTGSALVCLTTPSALKDSGAPFTEDQWSRILSAVNGSGSVAVPSTLAITAVAVIVSQL